MILMEFDVFLKSLINTARKTGTESAKKNGLQKLDDKEALRRWKLTKRNKSIFFTKYSVSEGFIESQVEKIESYVWRAISQYQSLSSEFIVRYMDKIDFSLLQYNPFINQKELQEKGIYMMAKLST
jgi:hypothetical protein